ncbi:MAG: acetylglutamate kinase [Chloroflexota bacterium]|nr:acetylglutamate kinase [Chloroflexota bacterium]
MPDPDSKPPIVVKIGGSTLGNNDTSLKDLVALQQQGLDVVVVHGGGPVISSWMQRQGIVPRFVNGLRVTDADSLDIVVAVLTGLVNKELVGIMHGLGARVLGMSGIDAGILEARVANPDLGYVGEITRVNAEPINAVLRGGYIPMLAPLAMQERDGSEHAGGALNINGDTVAGELAHALGAQHLIFLTDVPGVMDGNGRVMARLDRRRAHLLLNSDVVRGGMIPKLEACVRALDSTPVADIVDGREPGVLLKCLEGEGGGTRILG